MGGLLSFSHRGLSLMRGLLPLLTPQHAPTHSLLSALHGLKRPDRLFQAPHTTLMRADRVAYPLPRLQILHAGLVHGRLCVALGEFPLGFCQSLRELCPLLRGCAAALLQLLDPRLHEAKRHAWPHLAR
eukprot:91563-Rhodomonas_salina.1